jgi:hypothetical protein
MLGVLMDLIVNPMTRLEFGRHVNDCMLSFRAAEFPNDTNSTFEA